MTGVNGSPLRVLARLCWCGLPIESGETRIYRHIVTPTSSAWHHVARPATRSGQNDLAGDVGASLGSRDGSARSGSPDSIPTSPRGVVAG